MPRDRTVAELKMSCGACPAQWEGRTAGGEYIYVRMRHGRLSLGFGDTLHNAVDGDAVIHEEEGDRGTMSHREMLERTGLVLAPGLKIDEGEWEGWGDDE